MKHAPLTLLLTWSLLAGTAGAATYIGPNPGDWNTAGNWDDGVVPAISTGGTAVINVPAAVNYPAATLGDLNVNGGGSVALSNGAVLETTTTHWSQVNNGTLTLDGATFRRTTTGNLVGSQTAGTAGAATTSVISATNSSTLDVRGNLVLAYTNYTSATINLVNSSAVIGGELWFGSNTTTDANQTAVLNLNNSSITTSGTVGLWVWDYATAGNSNRINFTGPGGSFITVANSIGARNLGTGGTSNNQTTWETLWDLGILTAEGQSGLTGAVFGDWFQTSGTSTRETTGTVIPYTLAYAPVPEPSVSMTAALGMAAVLLTRRPARAVKG